ncbi:BZ3500_MvSof-1268-A1-R1_Chr1-3g01626 [Microbotryum saponariae]|uniref:BZ3500_MvSof-1268-A1-R1_Chr1-3g01626 protein n=1 Tax=Microbotryum saponariae TaxID=289078 RepID=A0A2X0KQ34_9BASI|nr:BZ3500_MvSof-1268-A1-R1_Chr1-3g01626 [Microbotryum saponariae]SCZ94178.1 BZ3501_MvSof-1269-A2-R1_Chr1-3g01227 [Microbotryum saponariae]
MADPARVTRRLPGAELERRRRGLVEAIEVVEVADDPDVPPDKGEGEVGVETGAAVVVCVSFVEPRVARVDVSSPVSPPSGSVETTDSSSPSFASSLLTVTAPFFFVENVHHIAPNSCSPCFGLRKN